MSLSNVLSMAGGLALFLYGMSNMGDGLSKLAGSKLEKILEKLTSKTIYGVLLGILVTAVIQSSSATTVMVVGFVNSGIMTLNQAVVIIMGANVGTTVTSWPAYPLFSVQPAHIISNTIIRISLFMILFFYISSALLRYKQPALDFQAFLLYIIRDNINDNYMFYE